MSSTRSLVGVDYPVARTGMSKWQVYEYCRLGIFPHVRIGKRVLFDPDQIEAWIANGGQALPGGWRRESAEAS